MTAVVLYEYGPPENLRFERHVQLPPVRSDTVLIKTAAASVNPVDWKVRSGTRQTDILLVLPTILGRDVSGVVHSVGSSVEDFKPGDRVLAFSDRTYAELVAVSWPQVTHTPDGLQTIDAAAIPLVCLTGGQLIRNAVSLQPGETVLITGALGGVGRAAVHTAGKMDCRVFAGVRRSQLAEAGRLNVEGVLAIDDDDACAAFNTVDAIADTVGGAFGARLIKKVKIGGSFGYASFLPPGTRFDNQSVTGERVSVYANPKMVREFAEDVRDGKFVLPIRHRFPLSEVAHAHRVSEAGGAGKIVLHM